MYAHVGCPKNFGDVVAKPVVNVREARGLSPLLRFEPPCNSMSPPIESIKYYFMPK